MSEALQKMVEAMGDEISRQCREQALAEPMGLRQRIDLEKVARAGLEAIREPLIARCGGLDPDLPTDDDSDREPNWNDAVLCAREDLGEFFAKILKP